MDAATGEERWAFETGDTVVSSPTVVGDTVAVGSQDGSLYALDRTGGTERWSLSTGGSVFSSPTAVSGTVYVGSGDRNLYAVALGETRSSAGSRVEARTLGHRGR